MDALQVMKAKPRLIEVTVSRKVIFLRVMVALNNRRYASEVNCLMSSYGVSNYVVGLGAVANSRHIRSSW